MKKRSKNKNASKLDVRKVSTAMMKNHVQSPPPSSSTPVHIGVKVLQPSDITIHQLNNNELDTLAACNGLNFIPSICCLLWGAVPTLWISSVTCGSHSSQHPVFLTLSWLTTLGAIGLTVFWCIAKSKRNRFIAEIKSRKPVELDKIID